MNGVLKDNRSHPTADFIQAVRQRFPVEREVDRILTRKMERRSGPGYSPISLSVLEDGARALIRSQIGDDFVLANARWLTGGASKLQVAFDLEWDGPDGGHRQSTRMVLRVEPPESVVETSRIREYQIIRAVSGIVPVPPCYWIDSEGEYLPFPALIYGFVDGSAKPTQFQSTQITGIGLNYGAALRTKLGHHFLEDMGRFHNLSDEVMAKIPSLDPAEVGSAESTVRQVNWWRRVWEEDRYEDEPLLEASYQWLIRNAPPLDHVSLVHGDCRGGNILFTEPDAKITAWLDWELAVFGDRHRDLAWSMMDIYRHPSDDGKDILISGFFPESEYLEIYEKASGFVVDQKKLKYFRVMCSYIGAVQCLGTAYRVVVGGKTHQDVLCAWLAMLGPNMLGQLRSTLEEIA